MEYSRINQKSIVVVSKFAKVRYDLHNFKTDDDLILLFGRESTGIADSLFDVSSFNSVFIPMSDNIRSINLSNACAIVLYEALRQNNAF